MAKFKAGDAVKLRDDLVDGHSYNDVRFVDHIKSAFNDQGKGVITSEAPTANSYYIEGLSASWIVTDDMLEAWPESTEETMSNEIDPQLLEIFKVIVGGFAAKPPTICYDHKGDIFLPIEPAIRQ